MIETMITKTKERKKERIITNLCILLQDFSLHDNVLTSNHIAETNLFVTKHMEFIRNGPFLQAHFTLFIQQVQDAKSSLDQVDTGLVVIEVYQSPRDLLPHVLLLLQLKHMLTTENNNKQNISLFV